MSIQVSNLSKYYENQKALIDISFEVSTGQIVGFLGPNGAGKSTLMKLLTTYLKPSSGSALVNGFDIQSQFKEVQKSIGYLPEHNPLYLNQYPKEYLQFNAKLYKVNKSRVNEVIELTGLSHETGKKIGELSKGYRQRVGLACALLHDPKVLLLDEPTTGLDPNQLEDIRTLIKNLRKDKTVLLSTHIMQEVEAMCDRVLVINKGELVADQSIESLNQKNQFLVEFDTPVAIAELQNTTQIEYVESINATQFLVRLSAEEKKSSVLFDFAVSQKVKLIQLQEKQLTIEELFKNVTT